MLAQISFGTMVGCDNDDCKYEWFHVECLQSIGINVRSAEDVRMCSHLAVSMEFHAFHVSVVVARYLDMSVLLAGNGNTCNPA